MKKAYFVKEITVIDPDSKGEVEMSVFKSDNGGIFAIDSSWIEQCTDEENDPIIRDPFEKKGDIQLTGLY